MQLTLILQLVSILMVIINTTNWANTQKKPNFHLVSKNVYRSNKLSSNDLLKTIKTYNIGTILNLRGKRAYESWWELENSIAQKHHIHYYNIKLSSTHFPSVKNLKRLIRVFHRKRKRSLLIHCKYGSHRSSLACGMYLIEKSKEPIENVIKQCDPDIYGLKKEISKKIISFLKLWYTIRQKHPDNIDQVISDYSLWLEEQSTIS